MLLFLFWFQTMTLFESQWMTIKQSARVFFTVCPRVCVVIIIMLVAERQREGSCPDMPDWIVPRCNCVSRTAEGSREHRSTPPIPRPVSWSLKLNRVSWMLSCLSLDAGSDAPKSCKGACKTQEEEAGAKSQLLLHGCQVCWWGLRQWSLYSVLCHWK